ncbi:MAG: dihydroorotate dehydrogenase [Acidobacteriia bacterium]|nr:dihydroorotate dehydrogenase [Terriglobia bacterium]
MIDLQMEIAGINFQNPVLTASGTFGYGVEFDSILDLNRLGGIVVKGISARPIEGNPPPRLVPTASGMLNSVGLQNIGARQFIETKLPFLRTLRARTIVNVFGTTVEDYLECLHLLNEADGIAAYELNISCPNTSRGGAEFSSDPKLAHEVVSSAKRAARRPLWVKLSPNVGDIREIALAVVDAGADALTMTNTFLGVSIDADKGKARIPRVVAGLSGPAIKPLVLRLVYQTAKVVSVPIIAAGGITRAEDALEFFMAGASAIEVGTANFYDPEATIKIIRGIEAHCLQRKIQGLKQLVRSLRV